MWLRAVRLEPSLPRPMDAAALELWQTVSNKGHLLSACCVPDQLLRPRRRHYNLHFTAGETEAQNRGARPRAQLGKDLGFTPWFFDITHTTWGGANAVELFPGPYTIGGI